MTARPIRRNAQTPDRNGKIFYTSFTSLSHLSKEGRIIAAISIDDDPQVERLDCWSHKLAPGAELSRLAVHPDFQNQKIARQMLVFGMEELARRGYKSVHFLVNKLNVKALRSYAVFGFDVVGECSLFGQPFLCYEKSL